MNEKFNEFRSNYKKIIYEKYEIEDIGDTLTISYTFEIPNLVTFNPKILINKSEITNKNLNKNLINLIVFKIGLIELISYYKCVCPKEIVIKAGYLDSDEIKWYKKLFYNGLGEFFYVNKIDITEDDLCDFIIEGEKIEIGNVDYYSSGNLIPIGGGKDSIVTLELLKGYDNKCFIINPKSVQINCSDGNPFIVKRIIDKNLLELNKLGYLNGHTPFSAIVAFVSYLMAYLSNKKNIVLSNEGSANEPTVLGTNINHQYSKTYEFERDFYNYTKKYFQIDINYFSLLRPLKEIQIVYLFSKLSNYHKIFRSCNVGSKEENWIWCGNCPKCLFVYIMLEAFLSQKEVIDIFNSNLLDNKKLEKYFLQLIGQGETKPFECIGTIEEVKYAMNKIIKKDDSFLSSLYKQKYYEDVSIDLTKIYYENNVPIEYLNIIKEAIKDER